jgi:hypothetical protein
VLLRCIEHRAVLVAFVQGVVSPFHENSCPLNERGGKETGKGADEIVPLTEVSGERCRSRTMAQSDNTALYRGDCGKLHIRNRLNGFPDSGAEIPD